MKRKLLIVFTLLLSCFARDAQARWATPEEAITAMEIYNCFMTVNADGTYEEEIEVQEKILKDAGRDRAAKFSFNYNGDSQEIKIISAKTIFNGKEYKVPKKNIEDKPLASAGQGFDHMKQVFIAFPNVEIGAQIYLKFKLKVKKPDIDNFFANLYKFGSEDYWKSGSLKIKSALPLNIIVNDPNKALKVVSDAKENIHSLEVSLIKPVYAEAVNEPETSIVNLKDETWVSISSLKDWKELALMESPYYEKVINQPLPAKFEEIVTKARQAKDELDQINMVTSQLNEKVQYMGDWRSVDGRFKPRDLDKIAKSQIGDCKDFSASTAAILRKLGFKVQVAVVRRGELEPSDLNTLPDVGAFNHAMLKVTNKQNKVYWIDPTNFVSMAGGVFPDIENKMALVLDPRAPNYEKIPGIDHQLSLLESNREIEIKGNLVDDYGDVTLKGGTAIGVTGASLNASQKMIEDSVFQQVSGTYIDEENRKSIELPDLSSRIVRDINFKVHYEQKNLTFKTNLGNGYPLKSEWVRDFIEIASDNVGDVYVGPPFGRKKRTLFKNIQVSDAQNLNYSVVSPWLIASRQCNPTDNGLEVIESIETIKSFIPNADLKTEEYKNLRDSLEQNAKNTALIFNTE